MCSKNFTSDMSTIDDVMKRYLQLKENEETTTEQWIDFTVTIARHVHELVQKAITTKKREDNRQALHMCNVGLLAARQVGKLHPLIPQLAFESGLLHFQARQFFKAGQLFFLAHRAFTQLGNDELSKKSLDHSINAFYMSYNEFITVAIRLALDYYHEIAWNYVIRALRTLINWSRVLNLSSQQPSGEHIDITKHLKILDEFVKNEETRFDKEQVTILRRIINDLDRSTMTSSLNLTELEREVLKLLPSRPRMILIIYEDGRLVYGYDFENKIENSPFLTMISGILFAIISLLSIELKVGTLNTLHTEEGMALVQKHDKVFFFLLCSGEPGLLRGKFESFIEEFIPRYKDFLRNWHGELRTAEAKALIEMFF